MWNVTGDTHGQFDSVIEWANGHQGETLIILGDAGINYSGGARDLGVKIALDSLGIDIVCIHGNHENRPTNIKGYVEVDYLGGKAYIEEEFPHLIFAKDGEVYDFGGTKALVIGGAYSVDKELRLSRGWKWFEDEQPSDEIKKSVEDKIKSLDGKVDIVLTHTCPYKYEPTEWFISGINQDSVDKTTEKWLDKIEESLDYKKWYCGHYHGEKAIDKLEFLYGSIKELKA